MEQNIEVSTIQKALDYAYEKAINGLPGTDTAEALAQSYLKVNVNPIDAANSLVNWQVAKCATAGFLTNIGGLMTLPVAIPANISSVLYVQIRMIASIAHIGGFDVKNDQVKTYVLLVLIGQSLTDAGKDLGIKFATKVAQKTIIDRIPGEVIIKINKWIGFRLLTKAGETGLINLTKLVPFIGGIVGGAIDGTTTRLIGARAIDAFCNKNNDFDIVFTDE